MTFGSLFTGIGGFDLGWDRAGMKCVWQVERDKNCNSVLERHWPGMIRVNDVRDVSANGLVRPDWLCGGFPCQDLSVAGRRAGLAGERSGLFWEFVRIIGEFAPTGFVIENVPGLLSSNAGRDMGIVLGALAKLGYGFAYRISDAQWFGVAQRRRRVFIVGCLGDWRRAAEILFERESLPWDSPPSREAGARVAATISGGAHPGGHNGQDDHKDGRLIVYPIHNPDIGQKAQQRNRDGFGVGRDGDPMFSVQTRPRDAIAVAYRTSGNCGVMEQGDRTASLNCGTDPNQNIIAYQCHGSNVGPMGTLRGGNGNETGGVPFIAFDERQITSRDNRSNPQPGDPCCTLHEQPPRIAGRKVVRRLLPIEEERLQGFPDEHTRYGAGGAEISDSQRYRMLGNAVAVPVAHWIGQRIMHAAPAPPAPDRE